VTLLNAMIHPRVLTLALTVAWCGVAATARAQAPWSCGPTGDARSADARTLDLLKNRTEAPGPADIDSRVDLAAIVAPGNDRHRWDEHRGAVVIGYVLDVLPGGVESANCHARSLARRDTHIEIVLDPAHSDHPNRVIVEVTPRIRAMMASRGIDWSTRTLEHDLPGHWVKVTGWLMFDTDHVKQSQNTAAGQPGVWRATAWEVHPVTGLDIVPAPGH